MSSPPDPHPDPLTDGARDAATRMMTVLSAAAQAAILLMEIQERRRARHAVTQAQQENAQAAAERARRATDKVHWQRALDDDWLTTAPTHDLTVSWTAARLRMHADDQAHAAVQRLETELVQREPRAMNLYRRLIEAPYPPEEAMRQAAEWFTPSSPEQHTEPGARRSRTATAALRAPTPSSWPTDLPDTNPDLSSLLTNALPDHANRILQDPSWTALATVLSHAQQRGADLRHLLHDVINTRELDSADNMVKVLRWRIERHLENPPSPTPDTYEPPAAPTEAGPPRPTPETSPSTGTSTAADTTAETAAVETAAVETEATEAARLARLAGPERVTSALRQQNQTGPAVTPGKVELGRERGQHPNPMPGPRPRRPSPPR
jgi:hypothetical protein